jgi:hypothetical protein
MQQYTLLEHVLDKMLKIKHIYYIELKISIGIIHFLVSRYVTIKPYVIGLFIYLFIFLFIHFAKYRLLVAEHANQFFL